MLILAYKRIDSFSYKLSGEIIDLPILDYDKLSESVVLPALVGLTGLVLLTESSNYFNNSEVGTYEGSVGSTLMNRRTLARVSGLKLIIKVLNIKSTSNPTFLYSG